jgi:hypothetical protein
VLDVTRSAGTTTYQDGNTNCDAGPKVKFVDASLQPLLSLLNPLAQ